MRNNNFDAPNWKKMFVASDVPEKLLPLKEISRNLWWCWNNEAQELFESIDPALWIECEHNPIVLLESVSYQTLMQLEADPDFMLRLKNVTDQFKAYMSERKLHEYPQIAYFSMEYGLHDSLKLFAGGLGILAGDYLKEASDSRVNLVAVGLLYKYGYFRQAITLQGDQVASYVAEQASKIPIEPVYDANGNWLEVLVDFPGREVKIRVWQVNVGSVKLYLLDADYEANNEDDRFTTHHLYGGDNENRLKQEVVLGIGGIRALKKMGYNSDIYHCNEGHAALIGLERIVNYVGTQELNFAEAAELVRSSTLFTTHTPVPAGHDAFPEQLFRSYLWKHQEASGINWYDFVQLGKANPEEENFNMSYLATHLSQGTNGVSKLHAEVSRELLKDLYKGYLVDEIEIGHVTNGVHYSTWTAKEWKQVHNTFFKKDFRNAQLDHSLWERINKVPDREIWNLRQALRSKLIDYVKQSINSSGLRKHEDPKIITDILTALNPNALTIGFARRFATYKRAHLLFRDLDRLSKIVNNPHRPVQFIFAGKAHPADKAGQGLIRFIIEIGKRPEFRGKIVFLENYNMSLAQKLVQGVDVWLNTPKRPLEASGTSGEKAVMNGALHFSVLDGWWVEGYVPGAGWALPLETAYSVDEYQDELDAETIYAMLENEVIEAFYNRNEEDTPSIWVETIKNSISKIAPRFTTARMMLDYYERFYVPQARRTAKLQQNNFSLLHELISWKIKVADLWNSIEVKSTNIQNGSSDILKVATTYLVTSVVDLKGLTANDVGLELVIMQEEKNNSQLKLVQKMDFSVDSFKDGLCTYKLDFYMMHAGDYHYGLRLYPKNDNLANRQDFRYIKWI